jgi:hypothetical protein
VWRVRRPATLLVPEAKELLAWGLTCEQAAGRLGVTRPALEKALARAATTNTSVEEEGTTMPFDPEPREATDYMRGAAYAHTLVMREVDAGHDPGQIEARHQAAVECLEAAASTPAQREFVRGYAETAVSRIATLREAEQAKADIEQWERDSELEAG